jgi:hypothetical protein
LLRQVGFTRFAPLICARVEPAHGASRTTAAVDTPCLQPIQDRDPGGPADTTIMCEQLSSSTLITHSQAASVDPLSRTVKGQSIYLTRTRKSLRRHVRSGGAEARHRAGSRLAIPGLPGNSSIKCAIPTCVAGPCGARQWSAAPGAGVRPVARSPAPGHENMLAATSARCPKAPTWSTLSARAWVMA